MSFLVQGVKQKQVNWKYYYHIHTDTHTYTRDPRSSFPFIPTKQQKNKCHENALVDVYFSKYSNIC